MNLQENNLQELKVSFNPEGGGGSEEGETVETGGSGGSGGDDPDSK